MRKFILIISLLTSNRILLIAQTLNKSDSLQVCTITSNFFTWYLDAINIKHKEVYEPAFIKNDSGMTTLDFKDYTNNLKKFSFSDRLIREEIFHTYSECIENLKKIKFEEFERVYNDLDQFEQIKCNFSNNYRWIGGNESFKGIHIKYVKQVINNQVCVIISYTNYDKINNVISYWGNNRIYFISTSTGWKIDKIDWR